MSEVNRRNFIQGAAAAGALGVYTSASAEETGKSANEKVVVGVMGLSRGRSLAVSFAKQPNVEVKYVCDVDSTRAASGAKLVEGTGVKAPTAIGDFRKILEDKAVDALVCAAPNHWHAPATIMACGQGKHVYVEKPCSHNPWEGETMVQAARKNKRCVQMGSQRRSGGGHIEAVKRLRDGAIGNVYLSKSWYHNTRGSIGKVKPTQPPTYLDYELWQGPAPRRPYKSNVVHYNWHWHWHWGNGELGNNGVHSIDISRWGLGVDYPVRVTSSGGRYHFKDDQETPDTHTVCFEFLGGKQIVWAGLSCNRHGSGFVSFYGTEGAMDLDSDGTFTIFDSKNKQVERVPASSRGDQEHIANFVSAIRTDNYKSLNAEIEVGHKSTLLCHLGNIAQRTGHSISVNPVSGKIVGDETAGKYWKRDYESGWEPKV